MFNVRHEQYMRELRLLLGKETTTLLDLMYEMPRDARHSSTSRDEYYANDWKKHMP